MSEIEEKAETLVRHLLGHEERKLRVSYLEAKLKHLPVEDIVDILNLICTKANAKILPCQNSQDGDIKKTSQRAGSLRHPNPAGQPADDGNRGFKNRLPSTDLPEGLGGDFS